MAFTKHAYFDAEVLEVKGSPVRQITASLDKSSEYQNYRTDDDYMYVRIRAISSRVNKNHDGWPAVELAGSPEVFKRHQSAPGFVVEASEGNSEYGFATFIGKPIFVDHNNSDPKKARGVIVDAKLRVLDQRTSASDEYWTSSDVDKEHLPPTEVELLLEVDAKQYPRFAKAIRESDLDGFSMGANVEYTKCSHCGNVAHDPKDFCSHVMMKGAHHDYKTADGKRVSRKSYENCYKCAFFEISGVFEPADETALAREVRAAVLKEGDVLPSTPEQPLPADPARPAERDQEIEAHAQWLMHQYGYDPEQALELAQQKAEKDRPTPGYGEGDVYTPKTKDFAPMPGHLHNMGIGVDPYSQEFRNDPRWSSQRTAENPLPQSMMTHAPEDVDTLREEKLCPICGSDMDSETCDVCGYVTPPKEFDNPDLQKAQEVRDEMKQNEQQEALQPGEQQQGQSPGQPQQPPQPGGGQGPLTSQRPSKGQPTASVTNDMRWTPKVHPKTAARINEVERPVRPGGQTSNEPSDETVVNDQTHPVTTAMKTARQLMATAQRNHTGETMNTRTADGPTPPGDTSPHKRVDVEGVGGVDQASNEEASRADAQVDVTGIGSTGTQDVSADKTETLPEASPGSDDAGFNTDKTTEDSGPTKTFEDHDGEEPGVTDPVTNETPYWVDESKWSHQRSADEKDKPLEQQEQQGGSTNDLKETPSKGTQPADPVGNAEDRVNLYDHTTSPANNSGPTKTWSGTDGNGVLKQQEPVTSDPTQFGGVKARVINAMRVADTEIDLGLIERDAKWNRIDELSTADPNVVATRLSTLQQVKTAGLERLGQMKTARNVPRAFGRTTAQAHDFERIASETQKPQEVDDSTLDAALFSR